MGIEKTALWIPLLILPFFLVLPSVQAQVTVTPGIVVLKNQTTEANEISIYPRQHFNIKTLVWYDISLEPVRGAAVYYNISEGENVNCTLVTYPLTQQLLEQATPGVYCSGVTCEIELEDPSVETPATYTVCVKATKEGFESGYGSATLHVVPEEIVVEPPPPEVDYTGMKSILALQGTHAYLIIRWNAYYSPPKEKSIQVDCFLNCENLPGPGEDLVEACKGIQNCSYLGPTGEKGCTIENPEYEYTKTNTVACRFLDPEWGSVYVDPQTGNEYVLREFDVIKFFISLQPVKVTVGEAFTFPIQVVNFGLLESAYGVNITTLQPNVLISKPQAITEEISYGEVAAAYPEIRFLVEQKAKFDILVNSTADRFECFNDAQCSHFAEDAVKAKCVNHACHKHIELAIDSGHASLSDFAAWQLFLLAPLAGVLILVFKRKFK